VHIDTERVIEAVRRDIRALAESAGAIVAAALAWRDSIADPTSPFLVVEERALIAAVDAYRSDSPPEERTDEH
jgi:hypothetical protein